MQDNKIYTIYAGVNGAGKSTLYKIIGAGQQENRVNSDEILVSAGGDWRNKIHQYEAMREALKRLKGYIGDGVSFNQETTLSGNIAFIGKAKEQGFKIRLYYVGLESADLAVERVKRRVEEGGHGVEEDVIRKRYESSLSSLQKVLPMCEFAAFYDNTEYFQRIAACNQGIWSLYDERCAWFNRSLGSNCEGAPSVHRSLVLSRSDFE